MKGTAVIIEDSSFDQYLLKIALEEMGYNVVGVAAGGWEGIHMIDDLNPDVVTLDIMLPDMHGFEVLKMLKSREKVDPKIVLISGVAEHELREQCNEEDIAGIFSKPIMAEAMSGVL